MTRAPANLLAVRTLLLAHLDNAPGPDDLEPAEVGIVGDPAHRGGYHCGSDRVVTGDYSVVESPRDRAGLTLDAAALDVGGFEVRSGGRTHTLQTFSLWCVGQCVANAPDTRDIREIIYSPDGTTVKRWDRLGKRSSGDVSHRWHTHFSFFRDAIKAGRDQRPLFRRYLSSIGLIQEDDMSAAAEKQIAELHAALLDPKKNGGYGASVLQMLKDGAYVLVKGPASSGAWIGKEVAALTSTVRELAAQAGVTPQRLAEIQERVDQVAEDARQFAEAEAARDAELAELVRQAKSGELDAAEFVRLVGEKLTAPVA